MREHDQQRSSSRAAAVPDSPEADDVVAPPAKTHGRGLPRSAVHHVFTRRFFRQVLRAYDSRITRAYLRVRFSIIRRILADLLVNLPEEGVVVNFGSGIGLFDIYGATFRPGVSFIGIDIDARRIAQSQEAARRLGLTNVRFVHGDITSDLPDVQPDAVVTLDVLHHIPPDARARVLAWAAQHLRAHGTLFVKDISTEVRWKVTFTRLLDDLMTRGEPVWYFSADTIRRELSTLGFVTTSFHLWDYIPFPHIIHIARKP